MKPLHIKLIVAVVCVLLGIGVWWFVKGIKPDGPKRQVARIAILPDTPPPPPPPKEEKKPEPPKEEPKQVMREEQIKQVEAPKQSEQLKIEGQATDAAGNFGGGEIKKDYNGGPTTTGGGGGPASTAADRVQERFYANSARQLLQGEIERHLKADAEQLTATFAIWLDKDGAIQRFELSPSGNDGNDTALRNALDETRRQLKLPPPPALALSQPMRFRLSVRPQA